MIRLDVQFTASVWKQESYGIVECVNAYNANYNNAISIYGGTSSSYFTDRFASTSDSNYIYFYFKPYSAVIIQMTTWTYSGMAPTSILEITESTMPTSGKHTYALITTQS